MSEPCINALHHLPQADSTNAWAKAHLEDFGPVGAVYTTDQTAGRGRLGRSWADAPGLGLYYSVVLKVPLAQPGSLPLFASLAVCGVLKTHYGVECAVKWPNDLLLNGKKVAGILCEGAPDGHSIVCGIGVNLAQPQSYFDAADLPHATSLALQGVAVDLARDPERLAASLTDFAFDRALYAFEREGFAAIRAQYKAACINLGRSVQFDGGTGTAKDIDEEGRLVVETATGDVHVFTGEVSVKGIYGAV